MLKARVDEKMRMNHKFRLYPSKQQEQKLLEVLDRCRFVYNTLLERLNGQKVIDRAQLQGDVTDLRRIMPELQSVYSKVLQMENHRLFSNLRGLANLKKKGRKVGRLRFKGKNWFKTFIYNQSGFKIVETGGRCQRLRLSKIGEIPMRVHRKVKGEIKQITVKRYNSGKWYALVSCEVKKEILKKPVRKAVGIDMGINHYATDSENRKIEHPHFMRKSMEKLRMEQRRLSKARKKSNNRNKKRIKLARVHEKVTNQRNDFLHKLSRRYADGYAFIAVEKLQISNMVKNHHLAQSIMDSSWGRFMQFLSYKAENAGGTVVKVNPRGTSIRCSGCGRDVEKTLAVRTHKCPFCGLEIDRDYNSAIIILKDGLKIYRRDCGMSSLLETGPLPFVASPVRESGSPFLTSAASR